MKSFRAWWDPQRKMWQVKESGETTNHIMTEGMFTRYRDDFQNRSDYSFFQRLKWLYWELDHTRYQWKEGIGIVAVAPVEPKGFFLRRFWRRLKK